jgi:hypothetical protein
LPVNPVSQQLSPLLQSLSDLQLAPSVCAVVVVAVAVAVALAVVVAVLVGAIVTVFVDGASHASAHVAIAAA